MPEQESAKAARELHRLLTRFGKRLVLAESCTGGLCSALFTEIPGASSVLWGGLVVYTEEAKTKLLGVDPDIISRSGVVSKDTALEMARGALALSGADLAIAITGYAGPEIPPDEKRAGCVCFAWSFASTAADLATSLSVEECFQGSRSEVRHAAAARAFNEASRLAAERYGRY